MSSTFRRNKSIVAIESVFTFADNFFLNQSRAVFTGGEDGFVRAWRADESVGDAMDMAASGKIKSKEKKHREKERFKPY